MLSEGKEGYLIGKSHQLSVVRYQKKSDTEKCVQWVTVVGRGREYNSLVYHTMSLKSRKILGISITTDSKKTILEYIRKYLESTNLQIYKSTNKRSKPLVIVTPNPEQIVLAQTDKRFAQILNQADVAIPDGIGIVIAERFLKIKNQKSKIKKEMQRVPGIEFMEDLVALAAARGYTTGLIGGRGGVAVEALECLTRKYPGLVGWAEEPGEIHYNHYNGYTYYNCYKKIKKTNTRLVFVGLGAPKQEYVIERLMVSLRGASLRATRQSHTKTEIASPSERSRNDNLILMSVGGSFDTIAGRVKRAPFLLRAIGLEWLWRLVREPWRWKRQLALLKFLWLVMVEKLASKG